MNTTQIKCFLALAETLNFTKAASQLFISQPGLSRQIVSLERELNTLLFIRDRHNVRLTPAAAVLVKELSNFENQLEEAVRKVQKIGQGYSGTLTLGLLGGQFVSEKLTTRVMEFMKANPNIDLIFRQGSFHDLRSWLNTGEIDIAVTLDFDVAAMDGVIISQFYEDSTVFAISKHTKTGRKKVIKMEDLAEETLIIISPDDCRAGYELVHAFLKRSPLKYSDIRYTPNLATVMMWIEAGLGFGLVNHTSNIVASSSIRLLKNIPLSPGGNNANTCFVWKVDNYNPAIPMFTNME